MDRITLHRDQWDSQCQLRRIIKKKCGMIMGRDNHLHRVGPTSLCCIFAPISIVVSVPVDSPCQGGSESPPAEAEGRKSDLRPSTL